MESFDEIVFLDSEIVDHDESAPVGTLVNAPDDNTALPEDAPESKRDEEVAPAKEVKSNEPADKPEPVEEQKEEPKQAEAAQPATSPLSDLSPSVKEVVKDPAPVQSDEPAPNEEPAPKIKKQPKKPTEDDIWAIATIKPKKQPVAKAEEEQIKEEQPAPKKQTRKAAKAEESPAEKPAKKAAKAEEALTKKTKAAKTENTPVDKPAKKTTKPAKAEETPAAKPAKKNASAPSVEPTQNNKKTPTKKEEKKVSNDEEKVLIEGDESKPQHGKFVIKKTDKGNFVYKLFSSNKRVVAVPGGAYKDLTACKGGIQSVINNAATAPIEDQTLKKPVEQKCPKWEIYLDNKGEFRLRLIASNGNVVAITNDGYTGKDAAKKGIDAIARAAQGASVVRNDDLW